MSKRLFEAAGAGEFEQLDQLIRQFTNKIDAQNDGETPLFNAARKGQKYAIELLLNRRSKAIDIPDKLGRTPMLIAAQGGHTSVIQLLLDRGSKAIDTPDNSGKTPLLAAAKHGHIEAIQLLKERGSKTLDTASANGWTPMHHAAAIGNDNLMETLILLGSLALDKPNKDGGTPLYIAAQNGHLKAVETLVRLGSQAIDTVENAGRTPIFAAAKNGHAAVIELLVGLESKAIDTPNNDGMNPMLIAAEGGHAGVIMMLAKKGSRLLDTPNNDGWTPLAIAISLYKPDKPDKQRIATVKTLLNLGADLSFSLAKSPRASKDITEKSAKLSLPPLLYTTMYSPSTRTLTFQDITNEDATQFPYENWRSCAAWNFDKCLRLTEIPRFLAKLNPAETTAIKFGSTANWSNGYEAQIAQGGDFKKIIEYAVLKEAGDPVPINECKMMAVGFAAVGKTTLIRRLREESYTHPLSTDGVDMGELRFSNTDGAKTRIVVWDFAGQPLYRQTHLLFLRNPGMCLLVFKLTDAPEKSIEQLQYWCDTLWSFLATTNGVGDGNNAARRSLKMLLVGTHLDRCTNRSQTEQQAARVWQKLQEQYPHFEIPKPVLVSCAGQRDNNGTIAALKAEIFKLALTVNVLAPACIESVRAALLPVALNTIPLLTVSIAHNLIVNYAEKMRDQLGCARLARNSNLREACLRALETLGSFLLLEKEGKISHVIANPQWAALLLATVVTTRHTFVTRGRVTYGTLSSQVWKDKDRFPPETHPTLAAILERLLIVFPLNKQRDGTYQSSQEFFVPSQLPEYPPESHLTAAQQHSPSIRLRRQFKLTTNGLSMPIRVLWQAIAQLMTLHTNAKLSEGWQQGGVLQIQDPSDLVVVSLVKPNADTVEAIVETSEPHLRAEWIREVSTILENQLDEVHHLLFEVRIPCTEAVDSCYHKLSILRECISKQCPTSICSRQKKKEAKEAENENENENENEEHTVEIYRLAPDLLFADLQTRQFVRPWDDVEIIRKLGKGSYGTVMLGQLTDSAKLASSSVTEPSSQVAIKLLNGDVEAGAGEGYREFQHEAYLMSLMDHPNIVRFVGACLHSHEPQADHERQPAFLMELVEGDTLYDSVMSSKGPLLKITELAKQLIEAIGTFNTAKTLHSANPEKFPKPEPCPLDSLCDGAMGRINEIFEQRICPKIEEGRDWQLELNAHLTAYHEASDQDPATKELHDCTTQLFLKIENDAPRINELLTPISWPLRLKLATDLASGLMYLHSLNPPMVHRDFKSPNVFLTRHLDSFDANSFDWSKPLAKVGDFGLSIRMLGAESLNGGGRTAGINATWAAPEVLAKQGYSTDADVYAMGITLWELLFRSHPFSEYQEKDLKRLVIEGIRPTIPDSLLEESNPEVRDDYLELMKRCWDPNRFRRPSMVEVFSKLRELSHKVAPNLFQIAFNTREHQPNGFTVQQPDIAQQIRVANIDKITVRVNETTEDQTTIRCLQSVGSNDIWVGLSNGSVAVVKLTDAFTADEPPIPAVACCKADYHSKDVNALVFSAAQRRTMWSGSADGRVFVWRTEVESLEEAKIRCYAHSWFTLVAATDPNLEGITKKALFCILRNGVFHGFLDRHEGPPRFVVDICREDEVIIAWSSTGNLELSMAGLRIELKPAGSTDATGNWQQTLAYLSQLVTARQGLVRLAASSPASPEPVFVLETTDVATWSLSLTNLVEWLLTEPKHGLHDQLKLEPGRQLKISDGLSHLAEMMQIAYGLAWQAPNILWLGCANSLAKIDLSEPPKLNSQSSSDQSQSTTSTCVNCFQSHEGNCVDYFDQQMRKSFMECDPSKCAECGRSFSLFVREKPCRDCIRHPAALLCKECSTRKCKTCRRLKPAETPSPSQTSSSPAQTSASPTRLVSFGWSSYAPKHTNAVKYLALIKSRQEIWTYSQDDGIFIWHLPLVYDGNDRIEAVPSSKGLPLNCLRQVGDQMWAGTTNGTVIGWDIKTRERLPEDPLPFEHRHLSRTGKRRPTSDIVVLDNDDNSTTAFSTGGEFALRKFTLAKRSE